MILTATIGALGLSTSAYALGCDHLLNRLFYSKSPVEEFFGQTQAALSGPSEADLYDTFRTAFAHYYVRNDELMGPVSFSGTVAPDPGPSLRTIGTALRLEECWQALCNLGIGKNVNFVEYYLEHFAPSYADFLANTSRKSQADLVRWSMQSNSYGKNNFLVDYFAQEIAFKYRQNPDISKLASQSLVEFERLEAKVYANFVGESFIPKAKELTQRSVPIEVRHVADSDWRVTHVLPAFEGHLDQSILIDTEGLINADGSYIGIRFGKIEGNFNVIDAQLLGWGAGNRTISLDTWLNTQDEFLGTLGFSLRSSSPQGVIVPKGKGFRPGNRADYAALNLDRLKDPGLYFWNNDRVRFQCFLDPSLVKMICVGQTYEVVNEMQPSSRAFFGKDAFTMILKKIIPKP